MFLHIVRVGINHQGLYPWVAVMGWWLVGIWKCPIRIWLIPIPLLLSLRGREAPKLMRKSSAYSMIRKLINLLPCPIIGYVSCFYSLSYLEHHDRHGDEKGKELVQVQGDLLLQPFQLRPQLVHRVQRRHQHNPADKTIPIRQTEHNREHRLKKPIKIKPRLNNPSHSELAKQGKLTLHLNITGHHHNLNKPILPSNKRFQCQFHHKPKHYQRKKIDIN